MNARSIATYALILIFAAACATGASGEKADNAQPAAEKKKTAEKKKEADREKELLASIKKAGEEGRQDEALARDLTELAGIYRAEGRSFDAEAYYQRALSVVETATGADSLKTAEAARELGRFYRFTGKPTLAEPLYRRSLDIHEKIYGPKSPEILPALEEYIEIVRDLNLPNKAMRLSARARMIKALAGK
ncbi:MAG: tetratricopeptide repeat protein [Candidatus Nitrospinota bacterium M3_3B_026]